RKGPWPYGTSIDSAARRRGDRIDRQTASALQHPDTALVCNGSKPVILNVRKTRPQHPRKRTLRCGAARFCFGPRLCEKSFLAKNQKIKFSKIGLSHICVV